MPGWENAGIRPGNRGSFISLLNYIKFQRGGSDGGRMRSAVKKEFAKFLFQRMSKERAVGLINSFPLLEMQKKILIEVDVLKIPQKQIAFDEGRDVKTISRRYNRALEMSSDFLTAYVSRLLECPGK